MRRLAPWALAVIALLVLDYGLGRVVAGTDPLAALVRGQRSAAPALLLFYLVRFTLILGLPTLAAWRLLFAGVFTKQPAPAPPVWEV